MLLGIVLHVLNLLISTACLLPRMSARYQGYILKLLKLTAAQYGGDSQGLSHRQGIKCINTYKEARGALAQSGHTAGNVFHAYLQVSTLRLI